MCGNFAHAQVVDDEQRHRGQIGQIGCSGTVQGLVGEFLTKCVGLAVDDAVALLDRVERELPDEGSTLA